MESIYLDTHVVVWLFSGETKKISNKAIEKIETSELLISPIVMLELTFLYEIKRLNYKQDEIIASLSKSIDLKICNASYASIIKQSTQLNWTRDPFDRLIVASAEYNNHSVLLSRDRLIRKNYDNAVW